MPIRILPARAMGWAEIDNGALIRAAQEAGFAIIITCDRNIRCQQNLTSRRIALIGLTTGAWPVLRNHLGLVVEAIEAATPGSYRAGRHTPTVPSRSIS